MSKTFDQSPPALLKASTSHIINAMIAVKKAMIGWAVRTVKAVLIA